MDENRIAGTAKNMGGKVQEGLADLPATPKSRLKELLIRLPALPKKSTAKSATVARMPLARHAITPHPWKRRFAVQLKTSLTPPWE